MNLNNEPLTPTDIIQRTQRWVEKIVIGLNLCPFAKAVYVKNKIRYAVFFGTAIEELSSFLRTELNTLVASELAIETTLIIHPYILGDFFEYNHYLSLADDILDDMQLTGAIQIASFHPDYQFAGTQKEDIENYTNRSPFPLLHLLREDSIDKAVKAFPDAAEIYNKNIATLTRLGYDKLAALIQD